MLRFAAFGQMLARRLVPPSTGLLLAMIVSSATANAASFDDDPGKAVVCPAIGCSDGGRECAKASGSVRYWMFIPVMPYILPMEYPFTVTCYESPAI